MNYAEKVAQKLLEKGLSISTTESCTGGLLSSKLTDVSGSSAFVTLNLVTYANEAKQNMLGVKKDTLDNFGAVSEECAFELTKSDICVSTTGIAGPTGGSAEKPVGLMYSTIYTPEKNKTYKITLEPTLKRVQMKESFAENVLKNIYEFIN